jgi:hypothetical protein
MGRYAKLGTVAVRWTALGFFFLALVFVMFGVAGGGTMMTNMMTGAQATMPAAGTMMRGGSMWWGPVLLNVVMGAFLWALSKPLGSLIGAGLDD